MDKKTVFFVVVSVLFVFSLFASFASASVACGFANATEINKDYVVSCATNYSVMTTCVIRAGDVNGNIVQAWYANPDVNGYANRIIAFNDRFSIGQNYTVNVTCAGESDLETVFVDVGGNAGINLAAGNQIAYLSTHPEEVVFGAVIVLIAGISAFYLFKKVRRD
jgi:hypothetical protein